MNLNQMMKLKTNQEKKRTKVKKTTHDKLGLK